MSGPRVLVANPSPLLRAIQHRALHDDHIEVIGEASSCVGAVEHSRVARPHVVLASSSFADAPLAHGLRELLATGARVLVVCDAPSPTLVSTLLIAGVSGYLFTEDVGPAQLAAGVRAVAMGDAALHPSGRGALVHHGVPAGRLARREGG